jgi:bifunctional DNase/RNase
MNKIELKIFGLSYSHAQSSAYALILDEKNGHRRLPIIVGGLEAQAIAIEVEKMKPARPLTHDLFKTLALAYNITIKEVIINKFHEGIFYSVLMCSDGIDDIQIDSRTSDAVALALRFNCPIYTYENILAVAGVMMDIDSDKKTMEPFEDKTSTSNLSIDELKQLLQKAIENEDYEGASLLRDEINKRQEGFTS